MFNHKLSFFALSMLALCALLLAGCNVAAPSQADTDASQSQPVAVQPAATAAPVTQPDSGQDAAQPAPASTQAEPQDTTPPTISVPAQQQRAAFYLTEECGFTSFQVDFQVSDDTGAEDIRVEYRLRTFDGEGETVTVAPNYAGMGSYQFVMPVGEVANDALQGYGGLLEYSVVALDSAGNQARYPEGDAWVQVVVLPCTEDVAAAVAQAPENQNANNAGWNVGTAAVCPPNCQGANVGQSGAVVPGAYTPPGQGSTQSGNNGGAGNAGGTSGNSGSSGASGSSGSSGGASSGGSSGSGSSGGATMDPCVANPSDPSCSGSASIDPCVANPSDPSCAPMLNVNDAGGGDASIDPCTNPYDLSCSPAIGGDGNGTILNP